jgi:hypothetical protein
MNRTYSFQNAPRCSATSKRTREPLPCGAGLFAASTERAAADRGASGTACSSMVSTRKRP